MSALPEALVAALADRYRLERELGAGGMATVYLAEDRKHHRPVAVKVLRPDLAATLGAERFVREIGIAARLSHPHILGLHDSGDAAGFLYYVMPYVEGISLRQKLGREGELPIPEAIRILRDIADAMAHAHAQGVVHRDLKPENVMLTGRHAVVMDFGVAKAVAAGQEPGATSLTSVGVALGTPAYMAPEQATGDPHVDARADVYAWGVVAYELLAGQPPFVRATPQATLAAQATAEPEPVSSHRAHVPATLATLVMQCLEKRAADRPQTAAEIVTRLEAVLTPSGGLTPTDTRPYQTAAARRAKRRRVLSGVMVTVAAAAMGVAAWRFWPRPTVDWVSAARTPVVVVPFETRGTAAGLAELGQDVAEQATVGLEQASLGPVVREQGEAATHVTGLIAQRGDSVEVTARVVRAGDRRTIWTLGPDRAAAGNAAPAVKAIRERILGAMAAYLSPDAARRDVSPWPPPPTLELSVLHQRANALFEQGKYREAIALWREAFEKDTTWLLPLRLLPAAFNNITGGEQAADSVVGLLEERRNRLTPRMQLELDVFATVNRSPEAEYQAHLALWQADSSDPSMIYSLAHAAERSRRPEEALEYFRRLDTTDESRGPPYAVVAGKAYHVLGRFEEELALARTVKARGPTQEGSWGREVRALAAMGRADSVAQVIAASAVLENSNAAGILMREAAQELGAHGHREAATALWERYLTEYVPRQSDLNRRILTLGALEGMGRYAEARNALLASAEPGPTGLYQRARAVRLAILAGDTTGAMAMVDSLRTRLVEDRATGSGRRPNTGALLTSAHILALLGRKPEAVAMLIEALNSGYRLSPDFELAPYWAPLRDYPPFQALVKPRG